MRLELRGRSKRRSAAAAAAVAVLFAAPRATAQTWTRAAEPLSSFTPDAVRFDFASVLAVLDDAPDAEAWKKVEAAARSFGFVDPPKAEAFAAAQKVFDDPGAPRLPVGDASRRFSIDKYGALKAEPTPFATPPKPEPRDRLLALALSGDLLVAAGRDRRAYVFRIASDAGGAPLAEHVATLTGPRNWITCVALSADGRWCAAGDLDGRIAVMRTDVGSTGATRLDVEHDGAVVFVAISNRADGTPHVVSLGLDGIVRARPLPAPGDVAPSPAHELDVRAVAFAGRDLVLSVGADQRVLAFSRDPCASRPAVDALAPFSDSIATLAVASSEVGLAAVGSPSGTFLTLRVDGDAPPPRGAPPPIELGTRVGSAAWRPRFGGWYVGCGDGTVRRVDFENDVVEPVPGEHGAEVKGLAFDATGTRMASAGADNTFAVRTLAGEGVDDAEGVRLRPPGDRAFGHWHCCAFDPAGRRVAAGALSSLVAIWDAATGEALHVLSGHEGSVEGVTWSKDGARVLSTSADGHVCVWDAKAGALLRRVKAGSMTIYTAVYSDDGRVVATAGQDGTIRLFSAETFEPLATFGAPPSVRAVALSKGGALAAAAYDDGVRVFDVDAPAMRYALTFDGTPRDVAFSEDGSSLAVRLDDRTTVFFEARSGERRAEPDAVAFAPSEAFDARALAKTFGPAGAASLPVRDVASFQDDDATFVALAEARGVVRVFRRDRRANEAALPAEVVEFRVFRDGGWAARTASVGDDGVPIARLKRADSGGNWLVRRSDDAAPEAAPPPTNARPKAARLSAAAFVPESSDLRVGEGVHVSIAIVNDGDAPAYQVGLRDVVKDEFSFFGLTRATRIDPGGVYVLRGYVERLAGSFAAARESNADAAIPDTALLSVPLFGAGASASAVLLVRRL